MNNIFQALADELTLVRTRFFRDIQLFIMCNSALPHLIEFPCFHQTTQLIEFKHVRTRFLNASKRRLLKNIDNKIDIF